jgi:hypothetical protein
MDPQSGRRLYMAGELPSLLQLNEGQVDHLIKTGQLLPIRICGEVRFDSRELDRLIETYRQIALRKNSCVQQLDYD